MTTDNTARSTQPFGVGAAIAVFLGVLGIVLGFLVFPTSILGGLHVLAIGLSLLLAGVFATEWAGDRFGLSAGNRRNLSLAFAALAVVLTIAFFVLGYATFTSIEAEETESSVVGVLELR